MLNKTRHEEFKTALSLFRLTIKDFSSQLVNPNSGKIGVSHAAVIQVSKYQEHNEWIDKEIEKLIAKARIHFPEYYQKRKHILKAI